MDIETSEAWRKILRTPYLRTFENWASTQGWLKNRPRTLGVAPYVGERRPVQATTGLADFCSALSIQPGLRRSRP